jgi:hypothetical protein
MRIQVMLNDSSVVDFPLSPEVEALKERLSMEEPTSDGWIPVEEALPHKTGRYLVCLEEPDPIPRIISFSRYWGWADLEKGDFDIPGRPRHCYIGGVLFWRELPEPKAGKRADAPAAK